MKRLIFLALGLSLITVSCKKGVKDNPVQPVSTGIEALTISSDFNWKTTKEYQVNLKASQDDLVEITNKDGVGYQKVFVKANEVYEMKLSLPSYEEFVNVKYKGQIIKLELNTLVLNLDLN
jgi:hypothetical protein